MRPFKFFQNKPERVFTDYMDRMDDYFLGGITGQPSIGLNNIQGELINSMRDLNEEIDRLTNPRYYDTEDFTFIGVTQRMFDTTTFESYKFMLFRHIESGEVLQGNRIDSLHPMFNYHNETI